MPFVSAFPNLSPNVASHLLKSGAPPLFTAFASAFSRQKPYLPDVFNSLDSHLSAGDSARAVGPSSNTNPTTIPLRICLSSPEKDFREYHWSERQNAIRENPTMRTQPVHVRRALNTLSNIQAHNVTSRCTATGARSA